MNNWFLASAMFLTVAVTIIIQIGLNYTFHESAGFGFLAAASALLCYKKHLREDK